MIIFIMVLTKQPKLMYCTVRVENSGLYKRGFNHFKPPKKLSHKHQVVTL